MKKKKKKVLAKEMELIRPIPNNYITIQMLIDSQNISTTMLTEKCKNGDRN